MDLYGISERLLQKEELQIKTGVNNQETTLVLICFFKFASIVVKKNYPMISAYSYNSIGEEK